ncbi:YtxH domain-containing protein [Leucobacter luti]|uniref:YtxH domain-containing protein n=1 Tax=Leucobacter luti TaxID=340320 RepID=UPI003CFED2AA
MKGKIAFVLGAAVGYVLGTRAGRERYEQIKRGAEQLWNTEPVQRGVGAVKGVAQSRVDELKDSVVRAGKSAFAALVQHDSTAKPAGARSEAAEGAARGASGSAAVAGSGAKSGSGAKDGPAENTGGTE